MTISLSWKIRMLCHLLLQFYSKTVVLTDHLHYLNLQLIRRSYKKARLQSIPGQWSAGKTQRPWPSPDYGDLLNCGWALRPCSTAATGDNPGQFFNHVRCFLIFWLNVTYADQHSRDTFMLVLTGSDQAAHFLLFSFLAAFSGFTSSLPQYDCSKAEKKEVTSKKPATRRSLPHPSKIIWGEASTAVRCAVMP